MFSQKTNPEGHGSQVGNRTKHCTNHKRVPWCLKGGGGGNKTNSQPLILSKKQNKTLDPKTKGEVGVTDEGGKKMYRKLANRRKSQTHSTQIFIPWCFFWFFLTFLLYSGAFYAFVKQRQ